MLKLKIFNFEESYEKITRLKDLEIKEEVIFNRDELEKCLTEHLLNNYVDDNFDPFAVDWIIIFNDKAICRFNVEIEEHQNTGKILPFIDCIEAGVFYPFAELYEDMYGIELIRL